MTGARSKFTPSAASSRPVMYPAVQALWGSPVAETHIAPGTTAASSPRRLTTPPSWSMVMKAGRPVSPRMSSCSCAHRRLSCAQSRTFSAKRMMLPTLYSFTTLRRASVIS